MYVFMYLPAFLPPFFLPSLPFFVVPCPMRPSDLKLLGFVLLPSIPFSRCVLFLARFMFMMSSSYLKSVLCVLLLFLPSHFPPNDGDNSRTVSITCYQNPLKVASPCDQLDRSSLTLTMNVWAFSLCGVVGLAGLYSFISSISFFLSALVVLSLFKRVRLLFFPWPYWIARTKVGSR